MALGAMPFGAGAFGASILPVVVTGARCVSLGSIVLECEPESDPGERSPWSANSVFYWRNWTLTPITPETRVRFVRSVVWDRNAATLELRLDGRLTSGGRYLVQCLIGPIEARATAPELHSAALRRTPREQVVLDLAKPERESALQSGSLGTFQPVAGDFAGTSGANSLHERVVRRVQTIAGEFVHDPEYGSTWKLKGLVTLDLLQRMQSRLTAQIKREPDVTRCAVEVRQVPASPGVVTVTVRADTVDGPVVVTTEVGPA